MIVQRLRAENTPLPPFDILRQQILESLVIKEIQLQRAGRAGIRVPDEMLNRALSDVARRNGVTLADLPTLLSSDGMDYATYRKEMREQLAMERLRQIDVVSRISVNERELEDYLDREAETAYQDRKYRISHILISIPAAASQEDVDAAEARAKEIYKEATDGADALFCVAMESVDKW